MIRDATITRSCNDGGITWVGRGRRRNASTKVLFMYRRFNEQNCVDYARGKHIDLLYMSQHDESLHTKVLLILVHTKYGHVLFVV